jgi:hypothetical protein
LGAGSTAYSPIISSSGQLASAIQSGNMQQVAISALGTTGTALTALSSTGAIESGTALAAAIPIIGTAIAGVMTGLTLLFNRKGPKQKVATTQIVNAVEPKLQENVKAYLALPVHYESAQKAALANFYAGWQYVVEHCNIPEMGEPGQRCTDDRKEGACKWRDDKGECWNWFIGYRDPILNDPNVVPDPPVDSVTGAIIGQNGDSGVNVGGMTLSSNTLLVGAGALMVLALSMGDSK